MSSPFDPSTIEAVILTGGASRRMGSDKATLEVDSVSMALRTARKLEELKIPVTVLGRTPLEGFGFIADQKDFQGPMVALSAFSPSRQWVFVASCDMPRFEASIVRVLANLATSTDADALIPSIEGRLQPLLGLYRDEAFASLSKGMRSMMAWLNTLKVVALPLEKSCLNVRHYVSANTPEELARILADDPRIP